MHLLRTKTMNPQCFLTPTHVLCFTTLALNKEVPLINREQKCSLNKHTTTPASIKGVLEQLGNQCTACTHLNRKQALIPSHSLHFYNKMNWIAHACCVEYCQPIETYLLAKHPLAWAWAWPTWQKCAFVLSTLSFKCPQMSSIEKPYH